MLGGAPRCSEDCDSKEDSDDILEVLTCTGRDSRGSLNSAVEVDVEEVLGSGW
jgi:hypothetical protein